MRISSLFTARIILWQKKFFFNQRLCADFISFTCALILDANLDSTQRLKNILRFFTCALNLFKPKIKFLFQTILILSQFVEKMKLAANEQAYQDVIVP